MKYQCWCPTDNRIPNEIIVAASSFQARKEFAARNRKQVSDCAAHRQVTSPERTAR
jgi:hypothetical protein